MADLFTKIRRKIVSAQKSILNPIPTEDAVLIRDIIDTRISNLSRAKLTNIARTVRLIEVVGYQGLFIEAGCGLGGASILIAKLKSAQREFMIYDMFEMIPPPHDGQRNEVESEVDSDNDHFFRYEDNVLEKVRNNLVAFEVDEATQRIQFIKGLLQDTMKINQPVVFAHIDVGWHAPVAHCLEQIVPNLVVGGVLILDDYHKWAGCYKAVEMHFSNQRENFIFDDEAGAMCITRTA